MKKLKSGPQSNNWFHTLKALNLKEILLKSIVMIGIMTMLFACKNDIKEIQSLEFADTLPDLSGRNIEMIFSESAMVQAKLNSPLVLKFSGEKPYMEFPEGFIVYFYDSTNTVESMIKADYGISYERTKIMEARYNVVVENIQKNEKLNTEELFWDQNSNKIYSNQFVKITRGDEILTGDGLVSDQNFDNIEIDNLKGLIEVEDEEEDGG